MKTEIKKDLTKQMKLKKLLFLSRILYLFNSNYINKKENKMSKISTLEEKQYKLLLIEKKTFNNNKGFCFYKDDKLIAKWDLNIKNNIDKITDIKIMDFSSLINGADIMLNRLTLIDRWIEKQNKPMNIEMLITKLKIKENEENTSNEKIDLVLKNFNKINNKSSKMKYKNS